MNKRKVIKFSDLSYGDKADLVVCENCDRLMVVNVGEEVCPSCGVEGCLDWHDTENEEVSMSDLVSVYDVVEEKSCYYDFVRKIKYLGVSDGNGCYTYDLNIVNEYGVRFDKIGFGDKYVYVEWCPYIYVVDTDGYEHIELLSYIEEEYNGVYEQIADKLSVKI